MSTSPLISQEEIEARLKEHGGWRQEGGAIRREFTFPSFKDAVAFVNKVAETAEEMDHHPDITINYRRVTLSMTTHSAGGLTRRDFRLAGRIDGLRS